MLRPTEIRSIETIGAIDLHVAAVVAKVAGQAAEPAQQANVSSKADEDDDDADDEQRHTDLSRVHSSIVPLRRTARSIKAVKSRRRIRPLSHARAGRSSTWDASGTSLSPPRTRKARPASTARASASPRSASVDSHTAEGYYLSDGHVNIAILRFKDDNPATTEGAVRHAGIHHFGVEVEDMAAARAQIEAAGAVYRPYPGMEDMAKRGNVEVKFSGPDGVTVDLSEDGWLGTDDD